MSENGRSTELHKKYRPTSFKALVGQPEAVKELTRRLRDGFPHALLLAGPSGTGKTTAARILKEKLGCSDMDFVEVNAAKERGLDAIRQIDQRMRLAPLGGRCRIWLLDESHHLTRRESGDAQTALLKMVEDTPPHVYFILCSTDPLQLRQALRDRCTRINFRSIPPAEIAGMLRDVAAREGEEVDDELVGRIIEAAEGSARLALNLLGKALSLQGEERLSAIVPDQSKQNAFELVKMLLGWERGVNWKQVAAFLAPLEEDWERFRRLVLANASKELLKGGKLADRAYTVLCCFETDWHASDKAGCVRACYEVFSKK